MARLPDRGETTGPNRSQFWPAPLATVTCRRAATPEWPRLRPVTGLRYMNTRPAAVARGLDGTGQWFAQTGHIQFVPTRETSP